MLGLLCQSVHAGIERGLSVVAPGDALISKPLGNGFDGEVALLGGFVVGESGNDEGYRQGKDYCRSGEYGHGNHRVTSEKQGVMEDSGLSTQFVV